VLAAFVLFGVEVEAVALEVGPLFEVAETGARLVVVGGCCDGCE